MGKSDKKVKSDRINALRKQYDAFLEDDKKRKERNEYILEHLDKMRYCNAMVQVRQKAPIFIDSRKVSLYNFPEQALDSPKDISHINLDTPGQRVDETVLLQEISKKYILIPKLRPTHVNNYINNIKPKSDENSDWKSKYDILDQLKRDEKGQDRTMPDEDCLFEPNQNAITKTFIKEDDLVQSDEPVLEYKNELPVKLPPEDLLPHALQYHTKDNAYFYDHPIENTNERTSNIASAVHCDNNLQNMVYGENNLNYSYNNSDNKNMIQDQNNSDEIVYNRTNHDDTAYDHVPSKDNNIGHPNPQEIKLSDDTNALDTEQTRGSDYQFDVDNIQSLDNSGKLNLLKDNENMANQGEHYVLPTDSMTQEEYAVKEEANNNNNNDVNTNIQSHPDQGISVQNVSASEMAVTNNETPPENDSTILSSNTDYPIETVSAQDFTPYDSVQLVDGLDINPEPQQFAEGENELNQHFEPIVEPEYVNVPGETFNTEQSEEFYTEQKENHDYTGEGMTENYSTDYTAPTENYQQNQEYVYYEGTQPEQPYTEMTDNDETTQQYDQNYEHQYGSEYDQQAYQQQEYSQEGYDQQGYEQQQQQYDPANQTQEDLHYENQDNLTANYVEQQLDNEQGYAETTAERTEESAVGDLVESQQTAIANQVR